MTLEIGHRLVGRIRGEAEAAYPGECCGIIGGVIGETRMARTILPAANRWSDDPHRYLIAPDDWRAAQEQLAGEGLEILGYYHSHPDHPPRPSAYDVAQAWPWYSYLIVEVAGGRAAGLTAWVLDEEAPAMRPETLVVIREV